MRRILLSAAALLAVAAPATAETTGLAGVSFSSTDFDSNFEFESWEFDAAVFHRFAGPWSVIGEGHYEDVEYTTFDFDTEGRYLALHGLYATESFTAGVLVGNGEVFSGFDDNFYGVEGAYRFANWTVEGSYVNFEDYDIDRYHLGAKYFFTDNFAVGGRVGLGDYGFGEWTSVDVGADYRFSSAPIVLTANYLNYDPDSGSGADAWTIGARWEFGSSSLQDADRTAPIADLRNFLGDLRRLD